jgi:hypothetical protein
VDPLSGTGGHTELGVTEDRLEAPEASKPKAGYGDAVAPEPMLAVERARSLNRLRIPLCVMGKGFASGLEDRPGRIERGVKAREIRLSWKPATDQIASGFEFLATQGAARLSPSRRMGRPSSSAARTRGRLRSRTSAWAAGKASIARPESASRSKSASTIRSLSDALSRTWSKTTTRSTSDCSWASPTDAYPRLAVAVSVGRLGASGAVSARRPW